MLTLLQNVTLMENSYHYMCLVIIISRPGWSVRLIVKIFSWQSGVARWTTDDKWSTAKNNVHMDLPVCYAIHYSQMCYDPVLQLATCQQIIFENQTTITHKKSRSSKFGGHKTRIIFICLSPAEGQNVLHPNNLVNSSPIPVQNGRHSHRRYFQMHFLGWKW